jgi:hypothetical protein
MHASKAVLIVVVLITAMLSALGIRVWWASSAPSRPKGLPETAIWVPAPPAPLDLSPRGYWLACSIDETRNVDHCKVTDYKGKSKFEADYLALNGPNPIPKDRLHLNHFGSTTDLWVVVGQELVPIARLEDGTTLVPTQYAAELRPRFAPK